MAFRCCSRTKEFYLLKFTKPESRV
jgi:hypothetical protein